MKTYKLKGLDIYVVNTANVAEAILHCRANKIGLTENDLEEFDIKELPDNPQIIAVGNFFQYHNNEITIHYPNYGQEDRNLGELFDWLGDIADIVQANEIRQFLILDDVGNAFEFTNEDEMKLARGGQVTLVATGETIEDFKESHNEFYNWFFNIV